jgi:hypothetical protein
MDNRQPPPDVIPVQSGQPLPAPIQAIALPPELEAFLNHLKRTGRLPAAPLSPEQRAAKLAKRAAHKAERNRKRDQRRKNRR